MKIVIDTNVWISFLLGKILSKLSQVLLNNQIEILTSKEQISELLRVVNKPKLHQFINDSDIQRLYYYLTNSTKLVSIENVLKVCRDPKDDFVIEIAVKGNADFLITGDNDLLVLNNYNNIRIISYGEFENILDEINY